MENSRYHKALADTTKMYEERIKELNQKLKDEHAHAGEIEEQLNSKEVLLREHQNSVQVKSTFISLSLSEFLLLIENTRNCIPMNLLRLLQLSSIFIV